MDCAHTHTHDFTQEDRQKLRDGILLIMEEKEEEEEETTTTTESPNGISSNGRVASFQRRPAFAVGEIASVVLLGRL